VFDKIIFKKTPTLADFSTWYGTLDGLLAQTIRCHMKERGGFCEGERAHWFIYWNK